MSVLVDWWEDIIYRPLKIRWCHYTLYTILITFFWGDNNMLYILYLTFCEKRKKEKKLTFCGSIVACVSEVSNSLVQRVVILIRFLESADRDPTIRAVIPKETEGLKSYKQGTHLRPVSSASKDHGLFIRSHLADVFFVINVCNFS